MQYNSLCIFTDKVSSTDKVVGLTGNNALHEALEIKCFYEGSATLLIGSQTVPVKAGDVVVINPYEFHATVNTGEDKGKYHLFMLPLDYFAGVPELDLRSVLFAEEKQFNTHHQDARLHSFLMQAAEEFRQSRENNLLIRSLMMAAFALLLKNGLVEPEAAPKKKALRSYLVIEPALRCIKNEYSRVMTVEELAKLCNVSKHYFCRVFKTITGKSVMEYLRDFRLRVANVLLQSTDRSISDIAACCGFDSSNYFSRCYKQSYGHSPRQGRNERLEG
jgi:AraC-like DNA-binding protein